MSRRKLRPHEPDPHRSDLDHSVSAGLGQGGDRIMEPRPVTILAWNTDMPEFRAEARRQMALVMADPAEKEFAEAWSAGQDMTGWTWDE